MPTLAGCRRLVLPLAVLLAGAPPAAAQAPGVVTGVVLDSARRSGVQGVEVAVAGLVPRAVTGEDGSFRIVLGAGAPPRVTLLVRRLGYLPASREVPGSGGTVEVALVATAVSLRPVLVSAERVRYSGRLAGYYERLERSAQGVFITRADIEKARPPQLTDLLQRSPNVSITRGRPGTQSMRMRGRNCRPAVWLDGAPMTAGDVDLDSFAPSSLEGIELYMGANAPARYQLARGQSECGTILLWSRGPDSEPRAAGRNVSPSELEAMLAAVAIHAADEVDTAAVPDSAAGWRIPYPPGMRAAGTPGQVLAEFVVDTAGRIEPLNFGIVSSTNAYFSAAVGEAAPAVRFRPAVLRGRRVRQLVRQSFQFDPAAETR